MTDIERFSSQSDQYGVERHLFIDTTAIAEVSGFLMVEAYLWAALLISSFSLIFAFIAFRQVMKSTSEVHEFLVMAKAFLGRVPKDITKMINPKFMGEAINHALLDGLENEDKSPVTMPQYVAGWINAKGPGIYADLKKEIPSYIPIIMGHSSPSPPQGPQTRQPNGQFGSGGLVAATNLAKAAKKLPIGGKVQEVVETGQAVVGLIGPIKEIIGEIRGVTGGKGGNGDNSGPSTSTEGASVEWGPPF